MLYNIDSEGINSMDILSIFRTIFREYPKLISTFEDYLNKLSNTSAGKEYISYLLESFITINKDLNNPENITPENEQDLVNKINSSLEEFNKDVSQRANRIAVQEKEKFYKSVDSTNAILEITNL